MTNVCHDFKTPRADASGRLPQAFMLLPVLVYIGLIGGALYNINSYLTYRNAVKERDSWQQLASEKREAQAKFESQMAELAVAAARAEKLAKWVEGTRTMQPICVAIARAMPGTTTLSDLTLDRSQEIPEQINMSVRINNGTMEEVGRIQQAIQSMSYRPFNSQELKNNDNLEYRTMLVWNNS